MKHWRPTASVVRLRQRAELLARIRGFFATRGVLEVSTPAITPCGVTDPNIESIELADDGGFLRTSPEYWHKRLLADGYGDLYEIGPAFRAGESGRLHQVEFTLLEWYRVGWNWRRLAEEVIALFRHCLPGSDRFSSVHYRSWNQCFLEGLGIDGLAASREELQQLATKAPPGCSRDMLLDYLFATCIQPGFDQDGVTVVYDFPANQAALARLKPEDPTVAERFEIFAGAMELANGYRELVDAEEQAARFDRDNHLRAGLKRRHMPIDTGLIAALESGLPECAGVALGVDRLLMTALGATEITEVMAFPTGHRGRT